MRKYGDSLIPLTVLVLGSAALLGEFVFLSVSGAAMSFRSFCGFSPPRFLVVFLVWLLSRCLFFCVLARSFAVLSLFCFVWGDRTRTGAMDWTALQRALLALTGGALCFSVQSAREQQSLPTWFVLCGHTAAILQMVHSVGSALCSD